MEILAPAGNEEALKAAIACGADAVYLGTKDFNARSKADNFSDEQLRLVISFCHERGVRVYITLNTLVKDSEVKSALSTVKKASEAGADAFLIQDLGLYMILKREFPAVSYHTSTQMGVHNLPGALMAEKLGFDRVVLSREALAEDIKKIKCNTNLEIEFFVHGAHCVSFSGNCYFSSMVSGYSGNRGKCLQLCRKKYELTGNGKKAVGYLLSAKDICMLSEVQKLFELGVDSLKIEGRLRSTEYVGTVTDIYRRAINKQSNVNDLDLLKTVFNRGNFSTAYIAGDMPDIIYPLQQNNIGLKVGSVSRLLGNTILLDKKDQLKEGNGYKVLRRGQEVGSAFALNGKLNFKGQVRVGDSVCLTKSSDIANNIMKKIAADKNNKNTQLDRIYVKNISTMSDIVLNKYFLPEKCKILQTDEYCTDDLKSLCDVIILSPRNFNKNVISKFVKSCSVPVLLDMPIEARGRDVDLLSDIVNSHIVSGYVANNIYVLEMCKSEPILLGQGMNSISELLNVPRIMSTESAFVGESSAVFAFGRTTLMNLTHCPKRQYGITCRNCSQCTDTLMLQDEMKNNFPLRRHKEHYCYWELLNGKITNILPKLDAKKHTRVLFDARNIDKAQIISALTKAYDFAFNEQLHTYGRYGKGVK